MATVAEHAIDLAERCEATLHTIYVVDDLAYGSVPEDARDRVREALADDGETATKAIAERALNAGLDVEREIRWGNPEHAIISYATENDVDLIVMGTHGRTGYERYLLESVAEKVVRASPVPVLTIRVEGASEPLVFKGADRDYSTK